MTTLTPKRIDPEWLNRWVCKGIELWSRAPLWLLVDVLFAPVIISLSSNIIGVLLLFIIPLSAFIFVQIRLIDHYGWISLSRAWIMLKDRNRTVDLHSKENGNVLRFFVGVESTLADLRRELPIGPADSATKAALARKMFGMNINKPAHSLTITSHLSEQVSRRTCPLVPE